MDGERAVGYGNTFFFIRFHFYFVWYICGSKVMCIAEGFPIMESWEDIRGIRRMHIQDQV